MPVSPAITTPELINLGGASIITRYLSPVQDTVIATALINQATFAYPLAQLTVDSTSADWLDCEEGDTVYIGTTPGGHEIGIYRMKTAPNSTTLFIGETSSSDPGLLPQSIRQAAFSNNNYVTVIDRNDIWAILPRIDPVSGTIYEDYNKVVGSNNTTPVPLVYVYINGVRNHLGTYIETDTLAITATVSVTKWPTSSGSSLTYLWSVPSGWTGVSGNTSATLTAVAAPGNYILRVTVTDSIGGAVKRKIFVNVHDAINNVPLLISNMPQSDTRDRVGRHISFDLYDNRLASIADGAMVIYFEVVAWGRQQAVASTIALAADIDNSQTTFDVVDGSLVSVGDVLSIGAEWLQVIGVTTDTLTVIRGFASTTPASHITAAPIFLIQYAYNDVPTATRQFVGWVQHVERVGNEGLRQATIDLISPANILALLNSTSQVIQVSASPTTWQQAVASLMSASFMAWYMMQWRVGNLLRLFNFTPFSADPSGQRLPEWQIDKGTILQQIQQLATDSGNFGANSEGEFFFLKLPQMLPYADRSSVVIRDNLDASIYSTVTVNEVRTNTVSQVRGEALSWDGSAVLPIPYYSDAPASPGQGGSQIKLLSQVVADQTGDNELTHNWYATKNNPYPTVTTVITSNRDVIEPAELPFVTVSIPAYLDPSASSIANTITWQHNVIPLTVNKKHNADGTVDIEMTGEAETAGFGAASVPVPAGNTAVFTPSYTPQPPDPPQPPNLGDWTIPIPGAVPPTTPASGAPTVIPGKGAIRNNGTKQYRTYDITAAVPVWDDVTPSGVLSTIVIGVMSQGANFSRGAYVLSTDSTNSVVSYTDDIFETVPVWTEGANITGNGVSAVSTRGNLGEVYVYSQSDGTPVMTSYLDGDGKGAWIEVVFNPAGSGCIATTLGTYNATDDRFEATYCGTALGKIQRVTLNLGDPSTVQSVEIDVDYDATAFSGSSFFPAALYFDGVLISTISATSPVAGTQTLTYNTPTGGVTEIGITSSAYTNPGDGHSYITAIRLTIAPTSATTQISSDYGVTFASPESVDPAGGTVGFDVGPRGLVSLLGSSEVVENAFGGVYSDETRGGTGLTGTFPVAIKIPDLRNGSASLTNISGAASYIFQTAGFVSGEAWFKVITTRLFMTPSVSGVKAVGVSINGIDAWRGKTFMGIGDVDDSGVLRYVFVSRSTGAGWSHTQINNAVAIRARRLSQLGNQWILSRGADGCDYTNDWGDTWVSKSSDETIYAEICF